ncbi:MAG: TRL-like family protein [Kiritimatiellaceae bacterium]|nr:TRL-like family protein [Kiritimatiellaceae bacterium]
MKKILILIAVAALFTGCATQQPLGIIVTDNTLAMQVGDNSVKSKKVGTAMSQSYLGMVAIGDCSIETACKNGGITKISHVDWKVKNILGLIGEYTTTVYGE